MKSQYLSMNRFLCIAALAIAGVLTVSSPAAATTLLLCSGSYETTFDPGLTFTPQDVAVDASNTYGPCLLSLTINSGTSQAAFTQPSASCLDLLQGTSTGQTTVTWNTGETTTYSWESTATQLGENVITATVGTVIAGKFLGKQVLRQSTAVQSEIESACVSPGGLERETGTVILTILGL